MLRCRPEDITGLLGNDSGQKETQKIEGKVSPINMEWITQNTSVDDFVISWLLVVCTPGSIRIYPRYRFRHGMRRDETRT